MPLAGPEHQEDKHQARASSELDVDAARAEHEQERGDDHRPGHVEPERHLRQAQRPPGHLAAGQEIVLEAGGGFFAEVRADADQDEEVDGDDGVIPDTQVAHSGLDESI
jgi:hypothetical protein